MQAFNRILVAVDGSESSMRAVRTAAGLARSIGASLTILHVMSFLGEGYSSGYPKTTSVEMKTRECAEGYLSLAREAAEEYGVNSSLLIIEDLDSPARGITEYASEKGVDLIVMGTRGLGSLKRLLLGSVSDGVVNGATCSVLVVRNVGYPLATVGAGKEGAKTNAAAAEAAPSAGRGSTGCAVGSGAGRVVGGT